MKYKSALNGRHTEQKAGKYIFGADVGGTNIKLGMFDKDLALIEKREFATPTENASASIVNAIKENILALLSNHGATAESIIGVGMGLPSFVEYDGYISDTTNLSLSDCNPARDLSLALNVPVFSENDANIAALGEFSHGSGKGRSNVVMVTLGTGIGAGIVWGGRLLRSPKCGIGEIGHILVEPSESDACGCGKRGCLEQYASATGVVQMARARLSSTDEKSVLRDSELSSRAVFDAAKQGDALALAVVKRFGDYLGLGLATVASILDPEAFIIGGGVSKAGEMIIELLMPEYLKNSTDIPRGIEFKIASLGNDAGIYGAAQFASDGLKHQI